MVATTTRRSKRRKTQSGLHFFNSAGINVIRLTNDEAENTMQLYQIVYNLLKESNKLKRKVKPMRRIQEHIDNNEEFAPRKIKSRQCTQDKDVAVETDELIIGNVAKIRSTQREWIYTKRESLLQKTTIPQQKLIQTLKESGVEAIFKCPIYCNNVLHFVDFYIPQYRVAIDLYNPTAESNREYAAIKTMNLETDEIAHMSMYEKEAFNPRIVQYIKAKRFKPKKDEDK